MSGTGHAAVLSQAIELPKGFDESVFASGLSEPAAMAFAPDGRLFVAERGGALRVVENGQVLPTPFVEVPVSLQGERGLVGVAVDPKFETNGHLYLYYTMTGGDDRGISHVSRFTASKTDPNVAEQGSELVLMELPNYIFHNAGGMRFGPDGMLYFGIGDTNMRASAQSLEAVTGKLHRIDPAGYPDIVPDDNPFVDTPGARPETWAYGFRNPFTFAIDQVTGRILVNDVGDHDWEEIDEVVKGGNYGWPICEGPSILGSDDPCSISSFSEPLVAYPHEGPAPLSGCSVIGGGFYYGDGFPNEYQGDYFFADYCGQWIARLTADDEVVRFGQFTGQNRYLSSLIVGPDGGIYYNEMVQGSIYRIAYNGIITEASASVAGGTAPLEVEFSAEGSRGPNGDSLSFTWDFGDGATATGATYTHRYEQEGYHQAVLTAHGEDGSTATETIAISVGTPPDAEILPPESAGPSRIGETVELTGAATSGKGGRLPPEALTWEVSLHDGGETEALGTPVTGSNRVAFTVPGRPVSPGAFYRVALKAQDSTGLTGTATYDISLKATTLTLNTEPAGLMLTVDGEEVTGAYKKDRPSGARVALHASSPQWLDGRYYEFTGWSGGEVGSGMTVVPDTGMELVATFAEIETLAGSGEGLHIYDDELHWSNGGWQTSVDTSASAPVFGGGASMAITYEGAWAGWLASTRAWATSAYTHLQFALSPGEWGLPSVRVGLHGVDGETIGEGVDIRPYASAIGGGWELVRVPLADLGAANTIITGIVIQENTGIAQPTFHIDDLGFVALSPDAAAGPAGPNEPGAPGEGQLPALVALPSIGFEQGQEPSVGGPQAPDGPQHEPGQGGGSGAEGDGSSRWRASWLVVPIALAVAGVSAFAVWRRGAAAGRLSGGSRDG
ncbi:MAG: PQQ-dependent sugar dehydrogenase [Dehalococcoidia bacterium]